MIYKLRYYVPLSTLKIVYFSLFHSHVQYSLLNWGRASKSILYKLKIHQNKILKAMLFCSKQDQTNLLYFKLKILKLKDMIAMEYAKFIFKFNNHITVSILLVWKADAKGSVSGFEIAHLVKVVVVINIWL